MPSYTQYKRQLSVVVDSSDEDITWITVKGNHIPIKKGQNKGDAIKEFFESKKSGGSKSDKGATSKSAGNKTESKSNKHDQLKKLGKEIVEHRKKWNEANELLDKGAFKDKTESHKAAIKRGGEELAKKEKEYEKLHAELTGGKKKPDLKKTYMNLWDKHKIESGSALYEDDTKAMKVFNDLESELKKHGINELSDDVYNDLEDNNYHSLNMMLSLSGKFGKEKQKNALAQIERWEKNGYKGSSFSTSVAKKMAQGESESKGNGWVLKTKEDARLWLADTLASTEGFTEENFSKQDKEILKKLDEKFGEGWWKTEESESKPLGTYEYHTDPGHGWLKVPMKEIEELGLKISEFSYQDGDFGYLEEDLDAGTFMRAYKEKYGTDPEHTTHHSDNWSHIREMRRFPKPKED